MGLSFTGTYDQPAKTNLPRQTLTEIENYLFSFTSLVEHEEDPSTVTAEMVAARAQLVTEIRTSIALFLRDNQNNPDLVKYAFADRIDPKKTQIVDEKLTNHWTRAHEQRNDKWVREMISIMAESNDGHVFSIFGPMYSAKSGCLEMLTRSLEQEMPGKKVKHYVADSLHESVIYARERMNDGEGIPATKVTADSLITEINSASSSDVLIIDEISFITIPSDKNLTYDQFQWQYGVNVNNLIVALAKAKSRGVTVVMAGLDMDAHCTEFLTHNRLQASSGLLDKNYAAKAYFAHNIQAMEQQVAQGEVPGLDAEATGRTGVKHPGPDLHHGVVVPRERVDLVHYWAEPVALNIWHHLKMNHPEIYQRLIELTEIAKFYNPSAQSLAA